MIGQFWINKRTFMIPADYYMWLSMLRRCQNGGERQFPCQVLRDQTNGYSTVFCCHVFFLSWLESRGETGIIKIELLVVGNAVVTSCLLKIDLDSGAILGHGSQHSGESWLRNNFLLELAVVALQVTAVTFRSQYYVQLWIECYVNQTSNYQKNALNCHLLPVLTRSSFLFLVIVLALMLQTCA